ncbi:hypothetical protein PAXRUDRAFT_155407, partial [Paxillus rubicundulus Ve08.2h10]
SHYNLYKDQCAEQGIVENHHVILQDLYNQDCDTKQMTKKRPTLMAPYKFFLEPKPSHELMY